MTASKMEIKVEFIIHLPDGNIIIEKMIKNERDLDKLIEETASGVESLAIMIRHKLSNHGSTNTKTEPERGAQPFKIEPAKIQ